MKPTIRDEDGYGTDFTVALLEEELERDGYTYGAIYVWGVDVVKTDSLEDLVQILREDRHIFIRELGHGPEYCHWDFPEDTWLALKERYPAWPRYFLSLKPTEDYHSNIHLLERQATSTD
jgi:hypothetical protein